MVLQSGLCAPDDFYPSDDTKRSSHGENSKAVPEVTAATESAKSFIGHSKSSVELTLILTLAVTSKAPES
jgi:hypothetical protein